MQSAWRSVHTLCMIWRVKCIRACLMLSYRCTLCASLSRLFRFLLWWSSGVTLIATDILMASLDVVASSVYDCVLRGIMRRILPTVCARIYRHTGSTRGVGRCTGRIYRT
ncbi:unnamed protein product [Ectocarpus sp. 13 AM-2016]